MSADSNARSPGSALITGAAAGIGVLDADRLARRGPDLRLVARDRARLETLATRRTDDTGRAVTVLGADRTNTADLARVAQGLRTDARMTVLVNNAGIARSGDLARDDPDRLERMIQCNVLAPSWLARAAMPGYVARGHGEQRCSLCHLNHQHLPNEGEDAVHGRHCWRADVS